MWEIKDNEPEKKLPDDLIRLIQQGRNGDKNAMEALYEHYKKSIFNLAYRYTTNRAAAEDLHHEIFIKVFQNMGRLDCNDAFVGWMYKVAINTCLSHLRSVKRTMAGTVSIDDMFHEIEGSAGPDPEKAIINLPMESAVRELPSKLRSVFLLHDVQGYKHREIADMLGISVGTSKSQLFKARMRIRRELDTKHSLR